MHRQVLALLLLLASSAGATDFYVDPVNGSDSGNGTDTNPWRTLQAVIEARLIETQSWESLPYEAGKPAAAHLDAGDRLFRRPVRGVGCGAV
jgi:hypothetical protein